MTITPDNGTPDVTLNVTGTTMIEVNGEDANITLNVMSDTHIEVNGEDATLADVQVGQTVRAEYDSGIMNAKELKVGGD